MSKMEIVGVIPARYGSSRFPGKPLADICGKPMIWWVYSEFVKVRGINKVYVATDSDIIREYCEKESIPVVMTSEGCKTHLDRLSEFCTKINADFYINVNGDEPLIEKNSIEDLLPKDVDPSSFYVANGMMVLTDPIDAVDTSKIKVVVDSDSNGMYMARYPIPFPKSRSDYKMKKFVGIQCFSKSALEFVSATPRGEIESIEDIDEYRFLENGRKIKFIMTDACTLSVDTRKDLDKVNAIIKKRLKG